MHVCVWRIKQRNGELLFGPSDGLFVAYISSGDQCASAQPRNGEWSVSLTCAIVAGGAFGPVVCGDFCSAAAQMSAVKRWNPPGTPMGEFNAW